MTYRQRLALNVAPVFLRLALGFVFVYAGAGKLFYTMPVQGHAAATLANLGLIGSPTTTSRTPPAEPNGASPEEAPADETEAEDNSIEPAEGEGGGSGDGASAMFDRGGYVVILAQDDGAAPRFMPEDFPTSIEVKRRLGLVLLINGAAERGDWPGALATPGTWGTLNLSAYAAALTEFVGGWLILLGFLTRIWSLGFAVTMVVALWLTQIAPSVGTEGALLGLLPELRIADHAVWTEAWKTLQFLVLILAGSLALLLIGPGKLSLDAILFRSRGGADPDDID